MKTTTFYLVAIMAAMTSHTLSGQGKNQKSATIESRQINGFHSLVASGLAEVYLAEGPSNEVKLVVSGMSMDDVAVLTADSVLNIHTKGTHNGESVKVYVNYVILKSIAVSGAAKLSSENTIKADNLTISVTNAGDATLSVDVNNLTLVLKQAGDLIIRGQARKKEIRSVGEQGTLNDDRLLVVRAPE